MATNAQEFTIKIEGIKLSPEHAKKAETAMQTAVLAVIGEFIGVDQDANKRGTNIYLKNMPWPGKIIDVQIGQAERGEV